MNVYGYIDKKGNVVMKGRIPNNKTGIPEFLIADTILCNSKLVMSCEVVCIEQEGRNVFVAHIMPHLSKTSELHYNKILAKINIQIRKKFGKELDDILYIRFRDPKTSFPITGSAKRNVGALREEGVSKAKLFKNLLIEK